MVTVLEKIMEYLSGAGMTEAEIEKEIGVCRVHTRWPGKRAVDAFFRRAADDCDFQDLEMDSGWSQIPGATILRAKHPSTCLTSEPCKVGDRTVRNIRLRTRNSIEGRKAGLDRLVEGLQCGPNDGPSRGFVPLTGPDRHHPWSGGSMRVRAPSLDQPDCDD